jgi:pimeloyl-ACP methyl ester carboxylesterase
LEPWARGPLTIARQGSFFITGQRVRSATPSTATAVAGIPDQSEPGHLQAGSMYVEYAIPVGASRPPVVLIHGGCHTGATYGETPDRREGWQTLLVRAGFPVYVVDKVGNGRSGFDATPWNEVLAGRRSPSSQPNFFQTTEEVAWMVFRFGPKPYETYDGLQFPLDALERYFAQLVPDVQLSLDTTEVTVLAVERLLDGLGGGIVVSHSQGGTLGWRIAMKRPDLVLAHVAVETGILVNALAPTFADSAAVAERLRTVPTLAVFGDYVEQSSYESAVRNGARSLADTCARVRSRLPILDLPAQGIRGNDHMMMMDRNNDVVLDCIMDWVKSEV